MHARKLLAALVALTCLALQSVALAAPEVYDLDKAHSSPGFKVRHFFTQVPGRFEDFTGTVSWDEAEPTKSTVELTIQATSINTGNTQRDNHLRSADFFDVEKFPTVTFKSTKFEKGASEGHFKVTGDLTIRGVTKPVVIELEALGFGDTPMGKRGGFNATTKINRQDFGVSWNKTLDKGGTLLGDEVTIEFPVELKKKST
jgi:polyisoprenoid-binding protein YceI